jgi:hypothetical protein
MLRGSIRSWAEAAAASKQAARAIVAAKGQVEIGRDMDRLPASEKNIQAACED